MNSTSEATHGRTFALVAAALVPFFLLAARQWGYGPVAAAGDWAHYLLHADALLQGRSYEDTGYIFTARNPLIGPAAQPPGLPLTLLPLLAAFGQNAVVFKVMMVGFAVAFISLVTIYFARLDNWKVALGTALLLGLAVESAFMTNSVMPDAPFCAFVWGVLWLADRPGPWGAGRIAGITVLGVAAIAYRLAGVPLLPALALFGLIHFRTHRYRPFIPVAIWSVCGIVGVALAPETAAVARLAVRDLGRVAKGVILNLANYPFSAIEAFLYPFPWDVANDLYHVAAALLAVVGFVAWIGGAWRRLLTVFTACYVGMLLLIPLRDGRYLAPVWPLLLFCFLHGLAWVASRVGALRRASRTMSSRSAREARTRAAVAGGAATVALGCAALIAAGALGRSITAPRPALFFEQPGVRELFAYMRTERARPGGDSLRVAFVNPRVLTWETGVPAMGMMRARPDQVLAELREKRITHVVLGHVGTDPVYERSVRAALAARSDAFTHTFAAGLFTVYRFTPAAVATP